VRNRNEFDKLRLEGRSPLPAVNIPYFEMLERGGKDEMLDSVVAYVERDLARMPVNSTNPARLREMVRGAYSAAAEQPQEKHAFPVGRQFAESIGYPAKLLARLPSLSCDAFAGVSNVSLFADLPPGATVLDLGCGAGLDTLIAAQRVGTAGKVIGVDFREASAIRFSLGRTTTREEIEQVVSLL
jgi:hypothetical protein